MESMYIDSINIDKHCTPPGKLHHKAESVLRQKIRNAGNSPYIDKDKMIYDLQLNQIKLEIQNKELRSIQEKLNEALDRYADLYNLSPVGYFSLDEHGRILEANLTGEMMMDVSRKRLIGMPFINFISQKYQDVFEIFFESLLTHDITHKCEVVLNNEESQGLHIQIEGIFVPSLAGNGNHIRLVVSNNSKAKILKKSNENTNNSENSNLNLNKIIRQVINKQKRLFSPNIKIILDTDPDLWAVFADQKMVATAVLNLCRSCSESIKGGGIISVTTRNLEISYDTEHLSNNFTSERYIYLEIENEKKQSKPIENELIVDLSSQALECNIGIVTASGIVKNCGGYINITENYSCGSRVMVYLPAV